MINSAAVIIAPINHLDITDALALHRIFRSLRKPQVANDRIDDKEESAKNEPCSAACCHCLCIAYRRCKNRRDDYAQSERYDGSSGNSLGNLGVLWKFRRFFIFIARQEESYAEENEHSSKCKYQSGNHLVY